MFHIPWYRECKSCKNLVTWHGLMTSPLASVTVQKGAFESKVGSRLRTRAHRPMLLKQTPLKMASRAHFSGHEWSVHAAHCCRRAHAKGKMGPGNRGILHSSKLSHQTVLSLSDASHDEQFRAAMVVGLKPPNACPISHPLIP